jgi:hypothetical protein
VEGSGWGGASCAQPPRLVCSAHAFFYLITQAELAQVEAASARARSTRDFFHFPRTQSRAIFALAVFCSFNRSFSPLLVTEPELLRTVLSLVTRACSLRRWQGETSVVCACLTNTKQAQPAAAHDLTENVERAKRTSYIQTPFFWPPIFILWSFISDRVDQEVLAPLFFVLCVHSVWAGPIVSRAWACQREPKSEVLCRFFL